LSQVEVWRISTWERWKRLVEAQSGALRVVFAKTRIASPYLPKFVQCAKTTITSLQCRMEVLLECKLWLSNVLNHLSGQNHSDQRYFSAE